MNTIQKRQGLLRLNVVRNDAVVESLEGRVVEEHLRSDLRPLRSECVCSLLSTRRTCARCACLWLAWLSWWLGLALTLQSQCASCLMHTCLHFGAFYVGFFMMVQATGGVEG